MLMAKQRVSSKRNICSREESVGCYHSLSWSLNDLSHASTSTRSGWIVLQYYDNKDPSIVHIKIHLDGTWTLKEWTSLSTMERPSAFWKVQYLLNWCVETRWYLLSAPGYIRRYENRYFSLTVKSIKLSLFIHSQLRASKCKWTSFCNRHQDVSPFAPASLIIWCCPSHHSPPSIVIGSIRRYVSLVPISLRISEDFIIQKQFSLSEYGTSIIWRKDRCAIELARTPVRE